MEIVCGGRLLVKSEDDQKKPKGKWRTIHGSKVTIENDQITKGPKHMVGKNPSEVRACKSKHSHQHRTEEN